MAAAPAAWHSMAVLASSAAEIGSVGWSALVRRAPFGATITQTGFTNACLPEAPSTRLFVDKAGIAFLQYGGMFRISNITFPIPRAGDHAPEDVRVLDHHQRPWLDAMDCRTDAGQNSRPPNAGQHRRWREGRRTRRHRAALDYTSTGSRFDRLICASAKLDSIEATPASRVSFSLRKRS